MDEWNLICQDVESVQKFLLAVVEEFLKRHDFAIPAEKSKRRSETVTPQPPAVTGAPTPSTQTRISNLFSAVTPTRMTTPKQDTIPPSRRIISVQQDEAGPSAAKKHTPINRPLCATPIYRGLAESEPPNKRYRAATPRGRPGSVAHMGGASHQWIEDLVLVSSTTTLAPVC